MMNRQDFFALLEKYDLRLALLRDKDNDNIGILKLYYVDIEICEILRDEMQVLDGLNFDNLTLQNIISILCATSEQELKLEAWTYKTIYKNFLQFQRELKIYGDKNSVITDRIMPFNDTALALSNDKQDSEVVVVSQLSNLPLFLILGILVLMAIIFELRVDGKDDEMQQTMFELRQKIASLEGKIEATNLKPVKRNAKAENNVSVNGSEAKEWAFSNAENAEIDSFVVQRASDFGIDPKIVKTIINIESRNQRFAIGIVSTKSESIVKALSGNDNIIISNVLKSKFVSLIPKDETSAKDLFDVIQAHKDDWGIEAIDYGLMQINHDTIVSYELEPKEIYLNPYYNIAMGVDVLKSCYNMFSKNQFNVIECYNKGTDKTKLDSHNDYYTKFINEYRKVSL